MPDGRGRTGIEAGSREARPETSRPDQIGPGAAQCVPPAHPWDGYLTGPENELAMAAAQAMARASGRGSRRWWCMGPRGGQVATAGGPGGRAAAAAAGLGRGAPGRRDVRRGLCRGGRRWPGGRRLVGAAGPVPRGRSVRARRPGGPGACSDGPTTSWRTRSMRSRPPAPAWRSRRGPRPGRGRGWSGRPG